MAKGKTDLLKTASSERWKRIGAKKRAGILVPLFSIHSDRSVGIGDLGDLKLLIDFCEKTGCSILQLLPMNEVGSTFCPYDAVSSFALEPSYVSLASLPGSKDKTVKEMIANARSIYPTGPGYVDYGIKEAKREILWQIFQNEDGGDPAFKKFRSANAYWLDDFAVYKVLKSHHAGKAWYDWREGFAYRDEDALAGFMEEHDSEILFQEWVQWILYSQFRSAKEHAASKGVLLKGDLPILISRDSADVWSHPEYFKLDFAAGAPPDMYCAKGQRWGMPTYDWGRIAQDKNEYPKEKLKYAENFYDLLRVDHAVGFFRIWSIPVTDPAENEGLNGKFDPADEAVWGDHGRSLLSMMLKNTAMLLCAEDLGMIPKACPETLKDFGIPGNEVQRWVKDWSKRHDFLPPDEYREVAVAMLSTHDTTSWAAWWESEAGTVDEALFVRKCAERGIDFGSVKDRLFDASRSRHGRLRWREDVKSKDAYVHILGKRDEELMDFIDMYVNSYLEKEKLWKQFGLKGPMREKCDGEIMRSALEITLASSAVFCIELLNDYLQLAGIFKGDPYLCRINKPGTVAKTNWSLKVPLPLEGLLKHKVCGEMRSLIEASGRA